jgi:RNA polymerase sigma-70 factor (ECF subfamily)
MAAPGSQRTVERLVADHYQTLYRYAFRLSGSAADAEDLTQDAFVKAQTKLGQLRDFDRAKPWLFSIVRNTYLHRLRERKHEYYFEDFAYRDIAEQMDLPIGTVMSRLSRGKEFLRRRLQTLVAPASTEGKEPST